MRTQQGFFYLAMVLDVFSRRLVGWMMGDTLRIELVLGNQSDPRLTCGVSVLASAV